MSLEVVNVGIGEIRVCSTPSILKTVLGSCVGVCVYDKRIGLAGLAHIVLPRYEGRTTVDDPTRYADSGTPLLVAMMERQGAHVSQMRAKLVGGARMFEMGPCAEFAKIGIDNARISKEVLTEYGIPVIFEEIGGQKGRSITFSATGELKVDVLEPYLRGVTIPTWKA